MPISPPGFNSPHNSFHPSTGFWRWKSRNLGGQPKIDGEPDLYG
jgi:hypothetical protein